MLQQNSQLSESLTCLLHSPDDIFAQARLVLLQYFPKRGVDSALACVFGALILCFALTYAVDASSFPALR